MRIPLLMTRGRVNRASPADFLPRANRLFRFQPTPKFRNPLPHPARVAVLSHRFTGGNLRVFSASQFGSVGAFHPEIIAGSFTALRQLNPAVSVARAVVLFTDSCSSPIPQNHRDWLWQRFAVPCFEQLLDARGQVIAEECHVHSGLHVLRLADISGTLTSVECECGRSEPRLL